MGLFKSKEEKQREKEQLTNVLTKWTEEKPSEKLELDFHVYKPSLFYADESVLQDGEKVLSFIGASFGKLENAKLYGVLITTDNRLLFVHKDKNSQYAKDWKYKRLNGLKLDGYPLKGHEFQIESGKSHILFHHVKKKGEFYDFIEVLQKKIDSPEPVKQSKSSSQPDKYKQLEQIGKLHKDGILTEEEFLLEKKKILNS